MASTPTAVPGWGTQLRVPGQGLVKAATGMAACWTKVELAGVVQLTAKFHDCAARVLPRERAEAVQAAVQALPAAPDASVLARLLSAEAPPKV